MTKIEKAIYYANKQVENHAVYIWGGQGQKLRKIEALELTMMETSAENAARVIKYIFNNLKFFNKNTRVFDCSGLICCLLIYAGVLSRGSDYTAADLYPMFDRVPISKAQTGDLIYKTDKSGKIVHVGLCVESGYCIEAKGRDYGVVRSRIDSTWKLANRPNY